MRRWDITAKRIMKKLMSLFAAILFAGAVFATTTSKYPDGWSYYSEVQATGGGRTQKCTVIRANVCGTPEYKVYFCSTWLTFTRNGNECYFYYEGDKITFNM